MSQYDAASGFKPLLTSTNDGNAFKTFLENNHFEIPPERHVTEAKDPAIIMAQFEAITKILVENYKSKRKTAVYIYYSGHGLLVDGCTVGCSITGEKFPLEESIRRLVTRTNCLVLGFLDCCRQIPPKGTKGKLVDEKTEGQLYLIHAVGPGKSATTRSDDVNGLSDVTKDFLALMKKSNLTFPASIATWHKYHKTVEVVDKMKWQFPLLAGTLSPAQTVPLPTTPFESWEPHEIAEWLSGLKLRENYAPVVTSERKQIDGATLKTIFEANEWDSFGFIVDSDILKVKVAMKKLIT